MDNVQCTGSELSILDCFHQTVDNCDSQEGAGVICSNSGRMLCLLKFNGDAHTIGLGFEYFIAAKEHHNSFTFIDIDVDISVDV